MYPESLIFAYFFLWIFNLNFKHIVLSHLNALMGTPYMVGKIKMSSFHPNLNRRRESLVAPDMSQTVRKGLVW